MKSKNTTLYSARGICWGRDWGFGLSGFKAQDYKFFTSEEELGSKIMEDIRSGAIDSGMGFETICGAVMEITIEKVKYIKGEKYTSSSSYPHNFRNADAFSMLPSSEKWEEVEENLLLDL